MKDKLTINELAPYLPYKLKISYGEDDIRELVYLDTSSIYITFPFKPLLLPLSDIKDGFTGMPSALEDWVNGKLNSRITDLPYSIVKILIKDHYDVFGLIERGLATDKSLKEDEQPK